MPVQFNLGEVTLGDGESNLSSETCLSQRRTSSKLSITYGHGIENYMNDAPVDVAPEVERG